MYTVGQVAKYLGISSTAVYKKLRAHEDALLSHILIEDGTKKIDEEGLKILMQTMGGNKNPTMAEKNQVYEPVDNQLLEYLRVENQRLRGQVDDLQVELKETRGELRREIEASRQEREKYTTLLLREAQPKGFWKGLFRKKGEL